MANRDAPPLPGFYFDEEKNRYFKLIPGQEHINPLTGEALNQPKHSGRSKVKKLHKKCLRKRQKNVYSLVRSREIHHTFSNAISDCVLTSIFDKTFQEDNFSNTHVVYEYDEANISRILPSSSYKKVLLQSGALTLTLVDGFDHSDNNALTMAVRYHFPADNGSLITDFSFADTPHTEEAILAAIVPSNGGSSYLIWGPDIEHCIHRKDQKEYIGCCKWHQDYMVYGVGSNFVLVYDCDDHFGNRNRPYVGAVHVKSSTNKLNHLTACECTQSVVYTGHRNGAIFGYDRRMLEQGACTTINSGASARNVCDIQIIDAEYNLLARYGSDLDFNYLWDLRFLRKPMLQFGSFQNSKNIGFRGMHKRFFLDFSSNVLSCYHIDGVLRLWNIRNGYLLSETKQLEGGIFAESWSLCQNQSGLTGLKNGRILWLPLKIT